MYQKIYLIVFFCFCLFLGNAQITSSESFNAATFPPSGWSIKVDVGPNNVWIRQTNGTNPTATPHSGAGMARYRSRNVTAGTKQILISRPIDYTNRGASAANLDFWMFRDSLLPANLDSLTVWVNSTDTIDATAIKLGTIVRNRSIAIPDTQAANGWYHYVFAIPASFTGTTTRFIFEGTSGTPAISVNQGANIFIDDISFDEFPLVCSGTPNVGSILNTNPILCGGGGAAVLNLSAPITGMPGITYTWQTAASTAGPWITIGTNAPTLNIASLVATAYFQCVVNCSFSSLSYTTNVDSILVSANPSPSISITPASAVYCAGSAGTQLVASGASSYSWLPSSSLNASNIDTVLATPITSTQYTITGTDAFGCTNTATVNVTFGNLPNTNITAAPNDTVCIGEQVILTSVPGGGGTLGNTYIWSNGITTRRDTIIVTSDTTLWVNVTNSAGCSLSDTITVIAIAPATADFTYSSAINTYTFTDISSPATSWLWSFGDGNGSSNQNPVYTYSAPGTYTVTLIISGTGCNDDTITQVIVVLPEGIDETNLLSQLNYYPNPVKDVLQLSLSNTIIDQVIIRNQVGQEISMYTNEKRNTSIRIPVGPFAAGIYFAAVHVDGKNIQFKFVKE